MPGDIQNQRLYSPRESFQAPDYSFFEKIEAGARVTLSSSLMHKFNPDPLSPRVKEFFHSKGYGHEPYKMGRVDWENNKRMLISTASKIINSERLEKGQETISNKALVYLTNSESIEDFSKKLSYLNSVASSNAVIRENPVAAISSAIALSIAEPWNLASMPIGLVSAASKMKTAARLASLNVAITGTEEAILHSEDPDRSIGASLVGIGASALIAAPIGAYLSKSKHMEQKLLGEINTALKSIDKELDIVVDSSSEGIRRNVTINMNMLDNIIDIENAIKPIKGLGPVAAKLIARIQKESPGGRFKSWYQFERVVNEMEGLTKGEMNIIKKIKDSDHFHIDGETFSGSRIVGTHGLEKIAAISSPLLRLMQSKFPDIANDAQKLMTTNFKTTDNLKGIAQRTSLESIMERNKLVLNTMIDSLEDNYAKYLDPESSGGTRVGRHFKQISQFVKNITDIQQLKDAPLTPPGKMSFDDFKLAVQDHRTGAMISNDEFIKNAANSVDEFFSSRADEVKDFLKKLYAKEDKDRGYLEPVDRDKLSQLSEIKEAYRTHIEYLSVFGSSFPDSLRVTPIIDVLKRRRASKKNPVASGGVKIGSQLATDLAEVGITPRSHKSLFHSKGSFTSIEQVSEDIQTSKRALEVYSEGDFIGARGKIDVGGTEEKSRILDLIQDELAGRGRIPESSLGKRNKWDINRPDDIEEVEDLMNNAGVDTMSMSMDEAAELIFDYEVEIGRRTGTPPSGPASSKKAATELAKKSDWIEEGVYTHRIWDKKVILENKEAFKDFLWDQAIKKYGDTKNVEADFGATKSEIMNSFENSIKKFALLPEERIQLENVFDPLKRGAEHNRIWNFVDEADVYQSGFAVKDIEAIANSYANSILADVDFFKFYRTLNVDDVVDNLRTKIMIRNPDLNSDERVDLIKDLAVYKSMLQRVRGTYMDKNSPVPGSTSRIFIDNLKKFNNITIAHFFGAASIAPDIGRQIMFLGLGNTFRPLIQSYLRGNKEYIELYKAASKELARINVGNEINLSTIISTLTNTALNNFSTNKFTTALGKSNNAMFMLNGLAFWNQIAKRNAGIGVVDQLVENAKLLNKGELPEAKMQNILKLGISEDDLRTLLREFSDHGQSYKGVSLMNFENWSEEALKKSSVDGLSAADRIQFAIKKEVDTIIVTPGMGDLPLIMENSYVSLITQYHSYALASMVKQTLPLAQNLDSNAITGILSAMMLGVAVDQYKDFVTGKESYGEEEWGRYLWDSLKGTGNLGTIGEFANYADLISKGNLAFALGPTATKMNDVMSLGGPGDGWSPHQVRAVKRLTPYAGLANIVTSFPKAAYQLTSGEETD